MVSCCNRRLYKGNSYEICLPITDTGVTSVRFYTSGDMVIEKEGEIVDDMMCFELTKEELDLLPDGVLRYSYDGFDSNTEYVVATPGDYSGTTLDDLLEDAFDSGYTAGQEDCSGDTCEGVFESGYTSGVTDGYASGYTSGRTDGYDSGYTSGKTDGYGSGVTAGEEAQKAKMTELDVDNADLHMSPGGVLENDFYREDGWNHVWVAVDTIDWWNSGYTSGVTEQKAKLVSTAITENGIYSREDGGFSQVEVNVPTGQTISNQNISRDILASDLVYAAGHYMGNQIITHLPYYTGIEKVDLSIDIDASSAIEQGYNSGYTSGYTDGLSACSGGSCEEEWQDGYDSGYTDGSNSVDCTDFYNSGVTAGIAEQKSRLSAITIDHYWGTWTRPDGFSAVTVDVPVEKWLDELISENKQYTFMPPAGKKAYLGVKLDVQVPDRSIEGYNSGYTAGYNSGYTDGVNSVVCSGYTQEDLDAAFASGWSAGYESGLTDCSGDTPSEATAITITVPQDLKPGDTGSTSISTSPQDAPTNLSYSSSDNSVATVDNNGNITAVGTGTTNICVTDSISQITECVQLAVNNPLLGEGDISATIRAKNTTGATTLCSNSSLGSIDRMAIDGIEITPVSSYTFGDTDLHTLDIWYLSSNIPTDAFEYAERIETAVIKDRMTAIGTRAFFWCTGLTSVQIGSGTTAINNSAFQGNKSLTSIVLPDSINTIGTYVFSGCTSLTSATIGSGITSISEGMFKGCTGLTELTINGNIGTIGNSAFLECKSLSAYPFTNALTTIGGAAFKGCESLSNVVMPDTVTSAGDEAFAGCSGMTAVTLSTGLTEIANYLFSSCSTLHSVSIPDTVSKIGGHSFEQCSTMTGVSLSSGLTEIGDYAFQYCAYLRGIDIPETVAKIGAFSFRFDTAINVNGITVRSAVPSQIGSQAFASTSNSPIYVPAESVETYKNSYYWATYADRIQAIQ